MVGDSDVVGENVEKRGNVKMYVGYGVTGAFVSVVGYCDVVGEYVG